MLLRQIKWNLRTAAKEFGIACGLCLGGGVFLAALSALPGGGPAGLGSILYLGIFLAGLVFVIVGLLRLFGRNLFSDEGYLTMSLPIPPLQLVVSRLLAGGLWLLLLFATLLISLLLSVYLSNLGMPAFLRSYVISATFADVVGEVLRSLGVREGQLALFWLLLFLSLLLSAISLCAQLFLACAAAHMPGFIRHRVLAGIGAYLLIQAGITALSTAVDQILPYDTSQEAILAGATGAAWGTMLSVGMALNLAVLFLLVPATAWVLEHEFNLE